MNPDHLILLIGTNPLPNYVVAKYFSQGLRKFTAVCTPQTYEIAQRLERVLKKHFETLEICYCRISDPGDAARLRSEMEQQLKFTHEETVHLNYTGGTKNMAVQSYRTLAALQQGGHIRDLTFSYLDAHDFKIKLDDGRPASADLRAKIRISIEDLLTLHGCVQPEQTDKDTTAKRESPDWSDANAVLQRLITEGRIHDFVMWKNQKIRGFFYDDNDKLRRPQYVSEADFRVKTSGGIRVTPEEIHPFHEEAMALIATFPEKQAWRFREGYLEIPDSPSKFRKKNGDFVQGVLYLDGLWLEAYTLSVLMDQDDFYVYPNLIVKKIGAAKDFEIDIVLLNGYQLCGVSITTALKESLCKSKAFEILHRSQQMGGEEARAVLVTALDEEATWRIQDDLKMDTGGRANLLVLGAASLAPDKLWPAIKQHLLEI